MFVCSAGRFQFKAIVGSDMRPFFAILGLLLCFIPVQADELPVIKDSEAVQYLGKNVEVRGLVVSVTISPLGTAMYQFRTRISQLDVLWVDCGGVKNGV